MTLRIVRHFWLPRWSWTELHCYFLADCHFYFYHNHILRLVFPYFVSIVCEIYYIFMASNPFPKYVRINFVPTRLTNAKIAKIENLFRLFFVGVENKNQWRVNHPQRLQLRRSGNFPMASTELLNDTIQEESFRNLKCKLFYIFLIKKIFFHPEFRRNQREDGCRIQLSQDVFLTKS